MEILMKLSFQWVVIDPKWTPDEEVMVVLLRHYAPSRDISECVALKDFTITLHTNLQNSRFLMRWKVDLMELQNNLGWKTHYNSNTLEMMMIRSHDFLRGHASYLLLEQTIFPKTLVFKINWHGGVPYLSSFALGSGDSIADAGPLTKVSTYH